MLCLGAPAGHVPGKSWGGREPHARVLSGALDPQSRDENIDYYIAKLDGLVKKFGGITAEAKAPR